MGGQRSQGKVLCPGKKTAKIHHQVEEQEEGKELQNKVDSLIPVRREKEAGPGEDFPLDIHRKEAEARRRNGLVGAAVSKQQEEEGSRSHLYL